MLDPKITRERVAQEVGMRLQGEMKLDEALWLLGSLCGLLRIPIDASLIAQSYPPPYTILTLHEAARALGDPLSSSLGS